MELYCHEEKNSATMKKSEDDLFSNGLTRVDGLTTKPISENPPRVFVPRVPKPQ
jgi:hypothetical protein